MKCRTRALFLCLGLLVVQPACSSSLTYSAEPIEARVIDADTKKPLEGVIVTANWQLVEGTLGGSRSLGQLKVMEAATDMDGKFTFPAWGPIEVSKGHLVSEDPQLLLFRSGYHYHRLSNQYTSDRELRLRSVRRSDWNGKTIEMRPFSGVDIQAQYKNLLNFSKDVDSFATWHVDPCQWTKLPIAINKLMQERKKLEAQGISSVWDRTLDQRLLDGEQYFVKTCGPAAQSFFKEMKK